MVKVSRPGLSFWKFGPSVGPCLEQAKIGHASTGGLFILRLVGWEENVSYSIWFLTMTWMTGGVGDAPASVLPPNNGPAPATTSCPAPCCPAPCPQPCCPDGGHRIHFGWHRPCGGNCDSGCDSCQPCHSCRGLGLFHRLWARLKSLFHRRSCCDVCCGKACNPCCQGTVPCRPPQCVVVAPPPPVPAPAPRPAPIAKSRPTFEIKKEYLDKVANAEDYSWVTGQLFYIHAEGGLWVVRYAPVDREDRYGGSVVLAAAASMRNCREGDLVKVHGEILNEGRASKYLGGPLYRALSVDMVARAEP